jgi:hypothetical protein
MVKEGHKPTIAVEGPRVLAAPQSNISSQCSRPTDGSKTRLRFCGRMGFAAMGTGAMEGCNLNRPSLGSVGACRDRPPFLVPDQALVSALATVPVYPRYHMAGSGFGWLCFSRQRDSKNGATSGFRRLGTDPRPYQPGDERMDGPSRIAAHPDPYRVGQPGVHGPCCTPLG